MAKSKEHGYRSARSFQLPNGAPRRMEMTAGDVEDYMALSAMGIGLPPGKVEHMAKIAFDHFAMDDAQGLGTVASITTPVQFLQTWLPGFVRYITAARKIDQLIGMTTIGDWEDEEVVQGVLEPIGSAVPYGDLTNVPLSSWNSNFERRTIVRYEKGMQVGVLEERRAAKIRLNTANEKRNASALALEVQRNLIGFYGYNSGNNRTYGFLNDPSLPAYYTVPNGANASPTWASKTFLEITADIRQAAGKLQTQSQDTVNPLTDATTLALPTAVAQAVTTATDFGMSVRKWVAENYPKMRIESAPQLNGANGGANVFYLYAESVDDGASDNSRVIEQIVPAKFMVLGVEKRSKSYVEDYSNASAGVIVKRPYAIVRGSGI
jgi:hypothetical protein